MRAQRAYTWMGLLAFTTLCWTSNATAAATTMEEVLAILRDRGVIDPDTQERLLAKHVSEEKQTTDEIAAILAGFEWSGDLRLRYEALRFDQDASGDETDNRDRFRYRARFGFEKAVTPRLRLGIRLASGDGDPDGTNRTLGASPDFSPDPIFFEQAWLDFALVDDDRLAMHLVGGRVANPYLASEGYDPLVWDADVHPTGSYVETSFRPSAGSKVFATVGGFILRENSSAADPKCFAGQLGFTSELRGVGFGLRGSWYEYRSLDSGADPGEISGFIDATTADGNLVGPSLDDGGAFDEGGIRVAEVRGHLELTPSDSWPLLVYGTFARNLSAQPFRFEDGVNPPLAVNEEEDAWGLGLEIGDKKKAVKLGAGYFHVEANSVVARFTDSNLFDGKTNREGWTVYAERRIASRTDLKLTFYSSDEIEDDGAKFTLPSADDGHLPSGPFVDSLGSADRIRVQADVQVSF